MSHLRYSLEKSDIQELGARLLSISLSKDEEDWSSVFHTHPFTELFFVVEGAGTFVFKDESRPIRPGDMILIPPYIEHTEYSAKGSALEYYVLGLDGVAFRPEDSDKCAQTFYHFQDKTLITDLFAQMLYEMRACAYGSYQICQNLLEILILRIIRTQKAVPVPISSSLHMTKECAHIKEYLDTNYSEHITLDSLTKLTHMNKHYMAHSFSKFTGESPIQYLNKRRLVAACDLLTDTDYSISAISSSVGFSSQSYFAQAFRKQYGTTPIKYRQMHSTPA